MGVAVLNSETKMPKKYSNDQFQLYPKELSPAIPQRHVPPLPGDGSMLGTDPGPAAFASAHLSGRATTFRSAIVRWYPDRGE
jgi:hypothetical protein